MVRVRVMAGVQAWKNSQILAGQGRECPQSSGMVPVPVHIASRLGRRKGQDPIIGVITSSKRWQWTRKDGPTREAH